LIPGHSTYSNTKLEAVESTSSLFCDVSEVREQPTTYIPKPHTQILPAVVHWLQDEG